VKKALLIDFLYTVISNRIISSLNSKPIKTSAIGDKIRNPTSHIIGLDGAYIGKIRLIKRVLSRYLLSFNNKCTLLVDLNAINKTCPQQMLYYLELILLSGRK
jgi:hypothetical protein